MAGTLVSTKINGDQTEFVCQAGETLLEVLRNRLGRTGSKAVSYTHLTLPTILLV